MARRMKVLAVALTVAFLRTPESAAQVRTVDDRSCVTPCALGTRIVVQIGLDTDTAVVSAPIQIADDARGNMFVLWSGRADREPPSVFSKTGKLLGRIGRRGSGPGETTVPMWVTIGKDDTVRIYDIPRLLTFDPSWQHTRTENEVRGFLLQRDVVPFDNGAYVALGSEPLRPKQARPIHFQRTRADSRELKELRTPENAGGLRVLAPTLNGGIGGRFWFAQFSLIDFGGYDLYAADTLGAIHAAVRRRPNWWHRETTSLSPAPTGTSRVVAIQEIAPDTVAVLVAQPLPNWRDIPIDPQTFAGVHSRYQTILEILDVRAGTVIGHARVDGYPSGLLRNRRFAVYRELDDGTPMVEIVAFDAPRHTTSNNENQRF